MSEPAPQPTPFWRVRFLRRGKWAYIPQQQRQPDLIDPAPPHDFGVRYLAALEAATQILHGADAAEVERHPPLGGSPAPEPNPEA